MSGKRAVQKAAGKGIFKKATKHLKWVEDPFDPSGALKPNVKYKTGKPGTGTKYNYATDAKGRISRANASPLKLDDSGRVPHDSNTPGKRKGDHAGHLFGDRFAGSPELDNLVSQSRDVNLSEFKKIENNWARKLDKEPPANIEVDIQVKYDGDSTRPSQFIVEEVIDGKYTKHVIDN